MEDVPDDLEDWLQTPQERIWHMKLGGMPLVQIAEKMGMTVDEVTAHYRSYILELASEYSVDTREQQKMLMLSRLDMVTKNHLLMAMAGDPKHTDALLKIMAMQIKLLQLDGTDPRDMGKTQVYLVSGGAAEFTRALQAGRDTGGPDTDDGEDEEGE